MPTLCAIPRGNRQFYLFCNPLSPNRLSLVYWLFLLFSSVALSLSLSTRILFSFRFFFSVFESIVCACECELWTMQRVVVVLNVSNKYSRMECIQRHTPHTLAGAHVCASINGTRGCFKCWVNFFTALQARTWFYYIFHSWQFERTIYLIRRICMNKFFLPAADGLLLKGFIQYLAVCN